MALVTTATFRRICRDKTTPGTEIDDALTQAVGMLEEALGDRPLEEASRSELMIPDRVLGRLYPKATPLVSVEGGYVIDGASLIGGGPFPIGQDFITGIFGVTVAYVGGFVERSGHPDAPNRLPASVEVDLCYAARTLLRGATSQLVPGTSSATVGDASVTFKDRAPVGADVVAWSRNTMRLRRRNV